jgi:hypothetical protein
MQEVSPKQTQLTSCSKVYSQFDMLGSEKNLQDLFLKPICHMRL